MVKRLIVLVAVFFLISCAAKDNPVLVGKINDYFAKTSTAKYSGSGNYSPMPFETGQYVVHGHMDGNKRSVSKTAIVGKEQGGWVIETHSIDPSAETTMQMLVTGLEDVQKGKELESIDILWVKIRNPDGQVQRIDGQMLAMVKGMYRHHLKAFDVTSSTDWGSGKNITVPAGTFQNTVSTDTEVSIMGRKFQSTSWLHSKVPVNGMVKSVSKDNNMTSVLLDFGYSDARRSF